jgi:S1-C subfamily serine protease
MRDRSTCSAVAVLLVVFSFSAGCIHFPSAAERAGSFAPHKEQQFGGTSAVSFINSRTALIIAGTKAEQLSEGPHQDGVRVVGKGSVGIATAIDPRGYFLTATHVLNREPVYAIVVEEERTTLKTPRIVWRGTTARGEPDLTILFISTHAPAFTWAREIQIDDGVFSAGPTEPKAMDFRLAVIAGKIRSISERAGNPMSVRLEHTVPIRPGDSGGPILNTDGKLIAISTAGRGKFNLFKFDLTFWGGAALRPDLDWLQAKIDADAATR